MAHLIESGWKRYKQVVSDNPEAVSQIEATSRVLSYIIAGRFDDSQVLSELVYLASNLLVLVNDQILKNAAKLIPKVSLSQERIQKFLTVLEYAEVFLEMSAAKYWGETGRWVLIVAAQITKSVLRLLMLWKTKAGIQPSPPLASLDRDALIQDQYKISTTRELNEFEENLVTESESVKESTCRLKRSGRLMRKLSSAPPMNFRSWKVPKEHGVLPDNNHNNRPTVYAPTLLSPQRMWAETLYITRPLAHLLAMYLFGVKSWKPWILSGGIDISSLCMLGDTENLNPHEKSEVKKRTLMLLYYMLRSPFYDQYSKAKILFTLKMLADHIPLVGVILQPMMQYLPTWQRIYFYMWST